MAGSAKAKPKVANRGITSRKSPQTKAARPAARTRPAG
jgi:hypothetical protein